MDKRSSVSTALRLVAAAIGLCLCIEAFPAVQVLPHLPNLTIRGFAQDRAGYVWIATDNGLCRYSGQTYYYYQSDPDDAASLPSNRISDICTDADGSLWVATPAGICVYDPLFDCFERLDGTAGYRCIVGCGDRVVASGAAGMIAFDASTRRIVSRENSPQHRPGALAVDAGGNLWGGVNEAVYAYGDDLRVADTVSIEAPVAGFDCSCCDCEGRLWFGTAKGIVVLDPETKAPITDGALVECLDAVADYRITMLVPAQDGSVYVGTRGDKLHMIRVPECRFEYDVVKQFPRLNYTSDFTCGFCDIEGNVYIGTADRGYSVHYMHLKNFTHRTSLARLTLNKYINAIASGKHGTLWVGSRYKGLLEYNSREKRTMWYTIENSPFMREMGSNGVQAIQHDASDRLWVNIDGRIALCSTRKVGLTDYRILPGSYDVNRFCEDRSRRMWAATTAGLTVWNGAQPQKSCFAGCNVQDIVLMNDSTMLAAVTGKGVFAVDTRRLEPQPLFADADSLYRRALKRASCLYYDREGTIWVGTHSYGLFGYHPERGMRSYTSQDGLSSDDVASLARDADGNTWVATAYGLSVIWAGTDRIVSYFCSDGLQTQQFCPQCMLVSPSMIYFGGNLGLAQFVPQRILSKITKEPVSLVLKELRINSIVQKPQPDGTGILSDLLNDTPRIVLDHTQNNIDIGYEAVTFLSPEKIRYAYRLRGGDIDEEWNYVESRRSANYAHLSPGHYVFELMAQNPDGYWNEEPRRLEIDIEPSPWLTWYAFLCYIVMAVTLVWFANRLYLLRRLQKIDLELAHKALEHEKELSNMKIDFFSNISHELRTPLSLIYGPVNMLPGITDPERSRELVGLINYNVRQLLRLVDQMLVLSRIENGTLPLSVCRQDIVPIVRRLADNFGYLAQGKGIELHAADIPAQETVVAIDADKFRKILSNLLSNALKYTPEGGHVDVSVSLVDRLPEALGEVAASSRYLLVSVSDDGIGMDREEVNTIFDRYKRLSRSERSATGNGIGLHYVKQLLAVHKGSIVAEVRDEGGMRFTFAIPVDEALYDSVGEPGVAPEFIDGDAASAEPFFPDSADSGIPGMAGAEADGVPEPDSPSPRPKLVLVEDNLQLQHYCRSLFAAQYDVFTAENGAEGFDLVNAEMPDLVITDVMMARSDGYELCRKIKQDPMLCHIPVIILTALVTDRDKMTGYSEGADAYMTKPFNPELLQTVARNLLTSRRKLRERILAQPGKSEDAKPEEELQLSAADRAFIEKLRKLIDDNISDSSLNINLLSTELCMSRASFFRKIKSLTGVTPNNFILIYRLNRAAEMIRSREYRLNEIADLLGFSSQSHFSRCFKQHFGTAPKDYASRSDAIPPPMTRE